ncbi:MAG: PKD domain-containing protein [Bacteroidales bacterium]|nr:PKD domain-containing protein [Bacteroidales bacterium]
MVMKNIYIKSIIWGVMLQMMLSNFVFAQSKHASRWYIGEYCINFNEVPAKPEPHNYNGYNDIFYTDSDGKLKLVYSKADRCVYYVTDEGDNISIEGLENIAINIGAVFVPRSYDENYVYLIFNTGYALIDLRQKKAIEINSNIWNNNNYSPVLFHHENCNDIWFVNGNSVYLITKNSIEQYPNELDGDYWRLSSDCKFWSSFKGNINCKVFFGVLDRNDSNFKLISEHNFSEYSPCYGTCFSSDNSKLYYLMSSGDKLDLLEFDIKSEIPDFEHYKKLEILSKIKGVLAGCSMYCGLDGNIYVSLMSQQKVFRIGFDENGNSKEPELFLSLSKRVYNQSLNFVSTWFSKQTCTPKISAENSCLGDRIDFSLENFSGVKTFLWNFGDGETSTEISPSHLYKKSGSYKVKLLIDGKDEYETDIEIYPHPKSPKVIETQ